MEEAPGKVQLLWIPLGAGQHVVRLSGRAYEAACARWQRRPRQAIHHAALVVEGDGGETVVEMTPIPRRGDPAARGVVVEGPVGLRSLGALRVFRYEVRCWRGGVIPDREHAVAAIEIASTDAMARAVLDAVARVPNPVWGRDELHTGEMWNSNSVVAWVLATAGVDVDALGPPDGGRAPGWDAGVAVARRAVSAA
jgi:hypothetical protein